jgi:uncharacterized protein DUF4252
MNKLVAVMILSAACALAQSLDLSSLDKLASKAKEVNRVSLTGDQLRAALQMLPQDENKGANREQLRKLVSGLTSVNVRNFEFASKGQYSDSDLNSVRSQMERMKGWAKIIDSKEPNEHSEVFMLTEADRPMGLAVIAAEPTEVSVIFIKGPLNLRDLGSLGGLMGLPSMALGPVSHPGAGK